MIAILFTCALLNSGLADEALDVGDQAPPIVVDAWLNLGDREAPSLDSLRGQFVMLEFWGTWCGPCVRAMPHVQALHDRYAKHGVVVLAISDEPADVIRPFLDQHGYSMIAGADPYLKSVEPYEVKSWPTTLLLDREGKVAWRGDPYTVEAALDELLGLPSTPGAMLGAVVAAEGDEDAQREALERLALKGPSEFDLAPWVDAFGQGPAAVDSSGTPISPASTDTVEALRSIARDGATKFDPAAWACETLASRFPLKPDDLERLIADGRKAEVVDCLATRNLPPDLLAIARGDAEFVAYCQAQ